MNQDPYQQPQEQGPQYPNQPQPNPMPMSYLDEIGAPTRQKTMKPMLLWLIIGGVLLLLGIIVISALSGGKQTDSNRLASFVYRVDALNKLTNDSTKTIEDSDLLSANGSLSVILSGIDSETQPFAAAASGSETLKPAPKDSPVTLEYARLDAKLDDARLNVVFDRTYAREVTFQLNRLRAEIEVIYNEATSQTLKKQLKNADNDLKKITEQFEKFDG